MLATSFEPKPPPPETDRRSSAESPLTETVRGQLEELARRDRRRGDPFLTQRGGGLLPKINYRYYPHVYTAKIVLTLLAMCLVWPGYRSFPLRVSVLSVLVGVVGVVLWIVLCHLRLEPQVIGPIDQFLGSFIPGLEEGDTPSIGLMSMLGTGERSAFNPLQANGEHARLGLTSFWQSASWA